MAISNGTINWTKNSKSYVLRFMDESASDLQGVKDCLEDWPGSEFKDVRIEAFPGENELVELPVPKDWGSYQNSVMLEDDVIVGFLRCYIGYKEHTIELMVIHPDHRRRGLYTDMCEAIKFYGRSEKDFQQRAKYVIADWDNSTPVTSRAKSEGHIKLGEGPAVTAHGEEDNRLYYETDDYDGYTMPDGYNFTYTAATNLGPDNA